MLYFGKENNGEIFEDPELHYNVNTEKIHLKLQLHSIEKDSATC